MKKMFFRSILLLLFLWHLAIWGSLGKIYSQTELTISVNNVAQNGELELRGLLADYPYPILTMISVVDEDADIVTGLADTLEWLGKKDHAENGRLISEIWHPVIEFFQDDSLGSGDSDLYHQFASPLFTEVRRTEPFPTSTQLIMDVSNSMEEELDDAKKGLLAYINLFRPVDRGGVIQFADSIVNVVPMTSDTTILNADVKSAKLSGNTALYDAIMQGIQEIEKEHGRRSIIVYTDGRDNRSDVNPETVIQTARLNNLPIYTIALGDSTEEEILIEMALKTGGIFFKAATAVEMEQIYTRLSILMQNYYVMAHGSPNPRYDQSWRTIDITTRLPNLDQDGHGFFYVGEFPKPVATDLALDLNSQTAYQFIDTGDTLNIVQPGEIYQYFLDIGNLGPNDADTVRLFHIIPDSVTFLQASPAPYSQIGKMLFWQFEGPDLQEKLKVQVTVQLAENIPEDLTEIVSEAKIFAHMDSLWANNYDADTVRIMEPSLPKNYDLSIAQIVHTDTTIDINGSPYNAVVTGDTAVYTLKIKNNGPQKAYDFWIWNVFPDSLTSLDFSIAPTISGTDTIFWQVDSLATGDSLQILLTGRLAESLPYSPFQLVNKSGIRAPHDTLTVDNQAETLIYGIQPQQQPLPDFCDVVVSQIIKTASFQLVENDTIKYVEAGEIYFSNIKVSNSGPEAAIDVTVSADLPDSIQVTTINPAPDSLSSHSLVWKIPVLEIGASAQFQVTQTVVPKLPWGENLFIHRGKVSAGNEDPGLAGNNTAIDTVFNENRPPTDWTPIIEATPPSVEVGSDISVRVQIPVPVKTWDVWVYLPNGVIDSSYANQFIDQTQPLENEWLTLQPDYSASASIFKNKDEQIKFELRVTDLFDDFKTATSTVTVVSNNDLALDRSVFMASKEDYLNIKFKLKKAGAALLEVFDITGTKITKITDSDFATGWNSYAWNGQTESGQKIGSGFYIITLRSNGYYAWKKLMIVR